MNFAFYRWSTNRSEGIYESSPTNTCRFLALKLFLIVLDCLNIEFCFLFGFLFFPPR